MDGILYALDIDNFNNIPKELSVNVLSFTISEDGNQVYFSSEKSSDTRVANRTYIISKIDIKNITNISTICETNVSCYRLYVNKNYLYLIDDGNIDSTVTSLSTVNVFRLNIAVSNSKPEKFISNCLISTSLNIYNDSAYYITSPEKNIRYLTIRNLDSGKETNINLAGIFSSEDIDYYNLYVCDNTAYIYSPSNLLLYVVNITNKTCKKIYNDTEKVTYSINSR